MAKEDFELVTATSVNPGDFIGIQFVQNKWQIHQVTERNGHVLRTRSGYISEALFVYKLQNRKLLEKEVSNAID